MTGATHRRSERRRTTRLTFAAPLTVTGESLEKDKFTIKTQSHSANANGGTIYLEVLVLPGSTLHIKNENTGQATDCVVVSFQRDRSGKKLVGIEFTAPSGRFWQMSFPPSHVKPRRLPRPD